MTTNGAAIPERLFSLDVMRGVAALSVIFWHWQHFFYSESNAINFTIESQPLFHIFTLLYTRGSLAVELFFSISGFVFFWLFSTTISEKKVSPASFFIDRFSRLYPLHIVTFACVLTLQNIYIRSHSNYFVYQTNDLYHGILNLFLAPAWGLEKDWSFNAPIWSVSIEVLLYSAFFAICTLGRAKYFFVPLLILAGYYISPINPKLSGGLFSFFCGGMAFIILNFARSIFSAKTLLGILSTLTLTSWIYICNTDTLNVYILMGVAFPLSVSTFTCVNMVNPNLLKSLSPIGDISYSTYLIHFPLQILFALTTDKLGFSRTIYYHPLTFIIFITTLILISFTSHKLLEMPIQQQLRKIYKNRSSRIILNNNQ